MEIRPIIHASAWNVRAVRSYSARTLGGSFQLAVTIRPSTEGIMWQTTYGRFARFICQVLGRRCSIRLASHVVPADVAQARLAVVTVDELVAQGVLGDEDLLHVR